MANFTPQEIEEMLQEFFSTVGKRQYVGARYVPIFGRRGSDTCEWDNSDAYEPLTIVYYNGDTYTSRRYVPAGIDISDTTYWVITGRYNAQVEQYRQEVLSFQGQIDDIRNDMESDYVPFPDSLVFPKYGTLGQVLTTLANGETKWENPVVPSDAQAEEVITAWLNDHPEATTTVQDGAITNAKMNASSFYGTDFMPRDWPVGETEIKKVVTPGIYAIKTSIMSTLIDKPSFVTGSVAGLLVFGGIFSGGFTLQIMTVTNDTNNRYFYFRTIYTNTGETYIDWTSIPSQTDVASCFKPISTPNGTTMLSTLLDSGVYDIKPTIYAQLEDLPSTGENTNTGTLLVYKNALNSHYVMQIYVSRNANVFIRYLYDNGNVLLSWQHINPTYEVTTPNILDGKKWAFCGDSFTNGDFTGYSGSDTTISEAGPYNGYASVYGYIIANRNNMVAQKVAANGETLSIGTNSNIINCFTNTSGTNNYTMIDSDVDYITIYYGINDSHRRASETEPVTIGTINDANATTFYGAWNVVLEYLITNYPFAKIGIIVSNACETDDYRIATIAAANKWGIPYIDLNGDERTPMMLRSTNPNVVAAAKNARTNAMKVSATNGHPNPAAHRYESTIIENFLRSL